jgi:hypothetical protein
MKTAWPFIVRRIASTLLRMTPRIAAVGALSLSALLAQDTTPPTLASVSFAPSSINVASAPANVTVNFVATDDSSGVFYVEVGFVDPTNTVIQRGCASAGGVIPGCSSFTAGNSVTSSLTVPFPRFSTQGAWTVGYVLIFDSSFNLTYLGPLGFGPLPNDPGSLQVNSVLDTTPPVMTAFTLAPASIDTTAGPATVNMNFTLTDDISGASKWQIAFSSPTQSSTQSATVNLTPATSVSGTASIAFPQFSEAGTWTITSVIISDGVGNTTVLGTSDLVTLGFTTTLTVISNPDTTPPTLTAFSFTPTSVNVSSSPGLITVNFQATDAAPNPSGVNSFEALFTSPSSATTLGATTTFTATASASGNPTFVIPVGSEIGTWTVTSVTLTDAVGNVTSLATSDLIAAGFPTQLNLVTGGSDTTPPVIVPTVTPGPNGFGWNNTPVNVSWSVTDPESGVSSSTGCGATAVSTQTTGITFTCTATNGAGLQRSVSVVVKIDTTPPTVFPIVSPTPTAGWNNTDTTVSWNLADAFSGLEADSLTGGGVPPGTGCVAMTFTAETGGITLTCLATDQAGNSASASVTIRIDKTAPTLTFGAATPAPNGAGWNNTNVSFPYTAGDNLSGVFSAIPASPVVIATEGTGLTGSVTVTDVAGNSAIFVTSPPVKIDKTLPVTVIGSVAVTPDPVAINVGFTLTATVTDSGGSNLASAEYNVDGGASFIPMTGTFGGTSANVTATVPAFATAGIHTFCVRARDVAGNIGASTECAVVAVYDPNGPFVTGGGAVSAPAGSDLANPSASGEVTFGFNAKYHTDGTLDGSLEAHFNAGNLIFKSTGSVVLVVTNEPRARYQGTGTINGGVVCSFTVDAWSGSFQPGNVDAFGLTITSCSSGGDRFNLPAAHTTRGSVKIHQ